MMSALKYLHRKVMVIFNYEEDPVTADLIFVDKDGVVLRDDKHHETIVPFNAILKIKVLDYDRRQMNAS